MIEKLLNIIALGGGVLGSALIAYNGPAHYAIIGYIAFVFSAVSAVILQWKHPSQRYLLWLNMYFICVNIFGLVRRIL